MGAEQGLNPFLSQKSADKISAHLALEMAELLAKMEFNPIGFINPSKSWGGD